MRTNLKHKKMVDVMVVLFLTGLLLSTAVASGTGVDPDQKHAWGENVGWVLAQSADHDLTIHYDEGSGGWLAGHLWGENIGWVVMGSAGGGPYANTAADNWGVNLAADGKLTGYAWGENVGWINFEQTHGQPVIDTTTGEFLGYAWGANIGWVSFQGSEPDYGIRTLAFDMQDGTVPNFWLVNHGVEADHDAGDGVQAWRKYVMDVDPTISGNALLVSSVTNVVDGFEFVVSPSSARRYYTLLRRESLIDDSWSSVVGQVSIPGNDGTLTLVDHDAPERAYYTVRVAVEP